MLRKYDIAFLCLSGVLSVAERKAQEFLKNGEGNIEQDVRRTKILIANRSQPTRKIDRISNCAPPPLYF